MPAQLGLSDISVFQVLREQLGRAARRNSFVLPVCLAQCERGACNLPGEVAFLKTTTARCCPRIPPASPEMSPCGNETLVFSVVVSEGQVCTLPSPQLCSIPPGILQIPNLLLCLSVSPTPGELSWVGVWCHLFHFLLSLSAFACLAAPGDTCPPLWGPLSPPKASFITQGGCLPFCAASSSSFPGLHPSEAAELGHCHGTFLVSPAQGDTPLAPLSQPCLPAHKLCLPQHWRVCGVQCMNSVIADFCFLPFHLLFPQSKAAAASRGLVLRQWWQLTAQGAEFQLFDPPSDLLTAPASISWGSPALTAYPTEVGIKLWFPQEAEIAESVQKLPSKVLCVPTEASRALGPLLGGSRCGGSRNRRLWSPQSPAPPEFCCQLWGQWDPSSPCRPCCVTVIPALVPFLAFGR